jgi:hypothetical protein
MMDSSHEEDAAEEAEPAACACLVLSVAVEVGVQA